MDFSLFEDIKQENSNKPDFPSHTPLAMAYVPMQQWDKTYNIEKGFCRGTVFPDLDFPFEPEEDCI